MQIFFKRKWHISFTVFLLSIVLAFGCFFEIGNSETTIGTGYDNKQIIWGGNIYVPSGGAAFRLSDTVFQIASEMGLTHLLIWQYNYNEFLRTITTEQMVSACVRMQNYGLQPIISLEYNLTEAVALVTALGSNCMMYTVGKEPHVSGKASSANVTSYIDYWNQIVSACRQINPDAMYGGPCVGSPTEESWGKSESYIDAWLQQCNGDFLVVHSFPNATTQEDSINRARSCTVLDMQRLDEKLEKFWEARIAYLVC